MPKDIVNEMELLRASISGNNAAFEGLVAKYQSLVCAITYGATGDVGKSEELAQETFVKAWKGLGQLRELTKFKAWLCSIARTTISNYRKREKRNVISNATSLEAAKAAASEEPAPDHNLIAKEQQAVVAQALLQLDESYREPLILFYRHEQSVRDVAEQLDLSEENVRTRLSRGRKMLKEQVVAMVEKTLSGTAPSKAFTVAVMASVAGIALKGTAAAAAVNVTANGVSAASSTGGAMTALMSTVTAKMVAAAAVIVIGIGAVAGYNYFTNPDQTSPQLSTAIVENEQNDIITNNQNASDDETTARAAEILDKVATVASGGVADAPENKTKETPPPAGSTIADAAEDEEYKFAAKGVLSGLITDIETGEPVVDAEVILQKSDYFRTKTDKDGFYSFEKIKSDGDYRLSIMSKEYVGIVDYKKMPQVYLKKDGQLIKHFLLDKACMVDVYVEDEDGKAVEGVSLTVTHLADERGLEVGSKNKSHRTDKDGYCMLGGIPADDTRYLITAVHTKYGKKVRKGNAIYRERIYEYAPGHLKVNLDDPKVIKSCRIVLEKGHVVRGIAKYPDGTGAKECEIIAQPVWWHCPTLSPKFPIDPNGAFTLPHVAEGSYAIRTYIPANSGGTISTVYTAKLPLGEGGLLEVTVPRKPPVVSSGGRRVKRKDAKPKIFGIVTDATSGEPIWNFQTRYRYVRGSGYNSAEKWVQFRNTKGEFDFDVTGRKHVLCEVQAVADGYASQWSEPVNTADKSAVVINLTKGGSLTGTVIDEHGEAVADAKVLPFSVAGNARSSWPIIFDTEQGAVLTDQMGIFTLKNLPAGHEYLKVTHPEHTPFVSDAITIKQSKSIDIGNVMLKAGGTVEGFVYDAKGNPKPNITLYAKKHFMFTGSDIQFATATTDPNGFYSMKNLPEGLCYITQGKIYRKTGVVCQAVAAANSMITRLDFGGGPVIKGQIVIDGKAITMTNVNLTLGDTNASGLFRYHGNTDENGRFMLQTGGPGTYTLSYDQRMTTSMSPRKLKMMDIVVGVEDIDLEVVPAKGKSLGINVTVLGGSKDESIRWLSLREDDPIFGASVYWVDKPSLSKPLQIDNLKPGLYYADAYLSSNERRSLPIEITEEDESFKVDFPIRFGKVTLTGNYPTDINHMWLASEDMSFMKIISEYKARETGKYSVEGLLPGKYYINPKHMNFTDCLVVNIPDTKEHTFDIELSVAQEKLKDDLWVHVMDEDGYPVENADVWVECNGEILRPAAYDGYSARFYLPTGVHVVHAEKDGLKTQKLCEIYADTNNTNSMGSQETFIKFEPMK